MLNIFVLIFGLILLVKGSDVFVDNASSFAKKLGIPSIIIGMTIVSFGTSAPELAISVTSSLAGMNDMSIANVVGSNIFNLLTILGVSSIISKLKITNYKDVFILLGTSALLFLFVIDGNLSFFNGVVLLMVFIFYMFNMIKKAKENKIEEKIEKQKPLWLIISLSLLGLLAIVWGGNLVVDSASIIATRFGMSQNLVGLTICSIGSSLPELVTSVIATKKCEVDIAVGNVIGSNIFNILLILGCASVINPMVVSTVALMDIIFMCFTVLVFILVTFKKKNVNKTLGIPMVLIYVFYIIITIIR